MADVSRSASVPEYLLCESEPDADCRELAKSLSLKLATPGESVEGLCLYWCEGRLGLKRADSAEKPVYVDFMGPLMQARQGPDLLLRAVCGKGSQRRPSVVDATAGLGRDSALLLAKGCSVAMIEQSPIACALLENALQRLGDDSEWAEVAARIQLSAGSAEKELPALALNGRAEVVYLDPMFAASGKSALAKKDMQMFQQLLGHGDDGAGLLALALECAEYRVVVKRALKAPALGGREPGFAIKGKAVRFDVYPLKSMAVLSRTSDV